MFSQKCVSKINTQLLKKITFNLLSSVSEALVNICLNLVYLEYFELKIPQWFILKSKILIIKLFEEKKNSGHLKNHIRSSELAFPFFKYNNHQWLLSSSIAYYIIFISLGPHLLIWCIQLRSQIRFFIDFEFN
jgi:hypothetical protein